ncbi:hypothetical protein E2C01_075847 [Portunus trituberculatus]|uniref:Uncharacterized protein n=1 Tax=Portunus trituberculatus TaxID=210409 RepID=A0A5B7I9R8_PORTR|nr:hypothetical protein [Portunus trituberculatus]
MEGGDSCGGGSSERNIPCSVHGSDISVHIAAGGSCKHDGHKVASGASFLREVPAQLSKQSCVNRATNQQTRKERVQSKYED